MKTYLTKGYDEMSQVAAYILLNNVSENPRAVIGLSAGTTLVGVYHELAAAYKKRNFDFSNIRTVNLDEFYPISPKNQQSNRYFMDKYLFERINIKEENIFFPDGMTEEPERFCEEYEKKIESLGGIDVMLLGLGAECAIGFNEPSESSLEATTHISNLSDKTIRGATQFFAPNDKIPRAAIAMGIETIFKARHIVILATDNRRRNDVRNFVSGVVSESYPATLFTKHKNITFICPEDIYPKENI